MGRPEIYPEHSAGFLNASWIAAEVCAFFLGRSSLGGLFCLRGLPGFLVDFRDFRKHVTLIFSEQDPEDYEIKPDLTPIPDERALAAAKLATTKRRQRVMASYLRERTLYIEWGTADHRLDSPTAWRRETRESLVKKVDFNKPLPFLSRFCKLYVDDPQRVEELALQVFIVLSRWGLVEKVAQADTDAVAAYIRRVVPNSCSTDSVKRAVSHLFTNWVMPQSASDLRSYVRSTVFGLNKDEMKRTPTPDQIENEGERRAKGLSKGSNRQNRRYEWVSVCELARRTGLHRQRINEAIQSHRLQARRSQGKFWISEEQAQAFHKSIMFKLAARTTCHELRKMGHPNEAAALRKKIYRHRKQGASDAQILEIIKPSYLRVQSLNEHNRQRD